MYQLNQPPTRQETTESSSCAETGRRILGGAVGHTSCHVRKTNVHADGVRARVSVYTVQSEQQPRLLMHNTMQMAAENKEYHSG